MMIVVVGIGVAVVIIGLVAVVVELRAIRRVLDRQGVQPSAPVVTQPTAQAWLTTDALQAAQEQQQTRAAAKIANAVKWR